MKYTTCFVFAGSAMALRRRAGESQIADLVSATSKILNALDEVEESMDRSVMTALEQWPLIPGSVEAPKSNSNTALRGSAVPNGRASFPLPLAQALLNVIISLVMSAILLTVAVIIYRHAVAAWLKKLSSRKFLSPVFRGVHKPSRPDSATAVCESREAVPALMVAPGISARSELGKAIVAKTHDAESDGASTADEEC
ncbi:hypothetical protein FOL47_005359 [Perkinsus chesapeaki]|uniref:Uncharacterized protein n=1 Tax=Perkinsus chesapeaki TaxID=330153 RepID=A0A7J6N3Q7_PERCH|nr:hypothetical protein FOL47_005359 [Perkinsus chesapeaki]